MVIPLVLWDNTCDHVCEEPGEYKLSMVSLCSPISHSGTGSPSRYGGFCRYPKSHWICPHRVCGQPPLYCSNSTPVDFQNDMNTAGATQPWLYWVGRLRAECWGWLTYLAKAVIASRALSTPSAGQMIGRSSPASRYAAIRSRQ